MDKTYQPESIEERWYATWEEQGHFAPRGDGQPFSIAIPPPNVTGSLHMGHAFQDTIMDALVRYHRMRGDRTLWQVGTDHAGIATQMVVERQLAMEGVNRHELGREAFIDRVWHWKGESGGTITRQLRRIGASVDWSRERFTMDEGLSQAVIEVFVRLYDEGLIYRGKRLVNWDPVLHTAISDLEVVSEEENGSLWHFRYPLASGSGHLVVATTRPETLLGDAAVAVHPDDPRYRDLVGQSLVLPLTGRTIPVIADAYVDPEFGSGCVKITPAHDFNDYDVWRRHQSHPMISALPNGGLLNVFTASAALNDEAPEPYRGLDRFVARKQIVADLDALGLVEKIEPHRLKVPRGDRSQAVVEPFLTDQWYVKVESLAGPAIEAVESGAIQFVPKTWENTYFAWMRDLQDWCISRQLWWGHQIPAWYDAEGVVYVGRDEAEVRARHGLGPDVPLSRDEDVLDTWFSSALWTFSTLGWPEDTEELRTFHPTSVLVTGFDIIFFWVARMIMMTLKFRGEVPFNRVYVHGLVRDSEGQKMSKSKGNVLDPIDLIDGIDAAELVAKRTHGLMQPQMRQRVEKATRKEYPEGIPAFGTDALRFTFCSLATTGRDIRFDLARIEGYRNFCNKLWNAARFVLMHCDGNPCEPVARSQLGVADRWIISRLQQVEAAVERGFSEYRFDLVARAIYDFTWNEYCDWYLEFAKSALHGGDAGAAQAARSTGARVLEALLRLAHPLMPFITEEIWQRVAPLVGAAGDSIMLAPYPTPDSTKHDEGAEDTVTWLRSAIVAVRNIRGEMNISPARPVPLVLRGGSALDRDRLDAHAAVFMQLARVQSLHWLEAGEPPPESATQWLNGLELMVPMAGLIDAEAERARLNKELLKTSKDLAGVEGKLGNPKFVERAPQEVVERERERRNELQLLEEKLRAQIARVDRLASAGQRPPG